MVAQLDTRYLKARPWKLWPRLLAYGAFEGRPLTTRGRWVNPFVLNWLRLCAALPLSTHVESPILIIGVGRSGTTILGKALGLHRDAGFLNEPKALWHVAVGDEDLIGSYSRKVGRFRLGQREATSANILRLHRCYHAYARMSGSHRVVDKYPELIFRTGLVDVAFPDAHKIVIIRDGWQTAASIQKWSERHGNHTVDWWGKENQKWHRLVEELVMPDPYYRDAVEAIRATNDQAEMAATEWLVTMREALALSAPGNRNVHLVKYEDLAEAPAAQMARLMEACGLNWDRVVTDYAAKSIRPAAIHPRPRISPAIADLVSDTMAALGYEDGGE